MSYPKNFAGNILMFFRVNIKCGFIAIYLCLQILFSLIYFEAFIPFIGQNNLQNLHVPKLIVKRPANMENTLKKLQNFIPRKLKKQNIILQENRRV